MKKLITILCFLGCYFFLQADEIIVNSSNEQTLNLKVSVQSELQFFEREYQDRETYSNYFVQGASRMAEGQPAVAGLAKWILIPNGTNVKITTNHGNPIVYENVILAPVQPEPFDNKDAPLPPFTKNEETYSKNVDFPGVFADVEDIKNKRGQALTKLWIYPYQYNPIQQKLTVYPNLQVIVSFEGTIQPIPRNLKSETMINSLKAMAINAGPVLAAEENVENGTKEVKDSKATGCELLIITHPNYEDAANTLASWKIRKGIYTWVVSTNTTGSTTNQIEDFIDNAYENWSPAPDYLLFIGDAEDIPVWYVMYGDSDLGTDFFYADRDDPPDHIADFGYGRLSVDNAIDADSLVARIIRYERTPSTNSSYYNNILNAACFQDGEGLEDPWPDEQPDGFANRRFCKTSEDVRNWMMFAGYSSQREYVAYNRVGSDEIFPTNWNDINQIGNFIFECDDPPNGGLPIPTELEKPGFPWDGSTSGISAGFNAGKFFGLFRAHGSTFGWGDPDFHSWDVDGLSNGEDRPIIWSITCQSGWFDNETDDAANETGYTSECFAEHWIRHATGGSCGVLAASRNSSSGVNDRFIMGMMDAIWPNYLTFFLDPYGFSDPIYKMGDVINYGKEYMASKYAPGGGDRTIELYHWFGDPTMEMWTSFPNELSSAQVTSSIQIGTSSISVQINPPVEDMLVSICTENSDSIFGTAYTNASGNATVFLNHAITMEGDLIITFSKHNYKPFQIHAGWAPCTWQGTTSTNWDNPVNWSTGTIPSFDKNVIIPTGCSNYPRIWAEDVFCNDLIIESGASLEIIDEYLNVYGDLRIFGELILSGELSVLTAENSIIWESGSSASILHDDALINIYKAWYFKNGANVYLDLGTVTFASTETGFIANYDSDSYFNDVKINKTSGSFRFHQVSTFDLLINGNLTVHSGTNFTTMSDKTIELAGNLNISGDVTFDDGKLKLIGNGIYLGMNGGDYFHDFEINTTSGCLLGMDLYVEGDFILTSGGIVTSADIYVQGNWDSNSSTDLFGEGTNKVVFNGIGNSTIWGEDFYTLEINKSGEVHFWTGETSCQYYDYESGNIWLHSGTVDFYDLVDPGLFGTIQVDDGTLNIYQDASQYPDLNCELYQNGGTINIYGGAGMSYWGVSNSCEIVIEDGILDFKDVGFRLYNSATYNLAGEINGGLIRTAGSITIDDHNIDITDGTFEMYGPDASNLSCSTELLNHLNINKNSSKDGIFKKPLGDPREKNNFQKDTKANDVSLYSNLSLNGNLTVTEGTLNCQGNSVTILGDLLIEANGTLISGDNNIGLYGHWTNNHGTDGFEEGEGQVDFLGIPTSYIYTDETFFDLETNKTGGPYDYTWIEDNIEVTVLNDLTINGCSFRLGSFSTLNVNHDIIISENTNLFASASEESYINVGNNWFNYNTTGYPWVNGFYYGLSTVTFNGTDDQFVEASFGTQDFYNLKVDKTNNWFMPIDHVDIYGDAEIVEGSWNQDASGLMFSFYGDLIIQADGSWDDHDNNLYFIGSDDTYIRNYGVNNAYFESIYISKDTITNSVILMGDLNCYYLNIPEGELFLNSQTLTCDWRIQIADGGILSGYYSSTINMADQGIILVGGGGELHLFGDGTNNPLVTSTTGNYALSVYNSGVLAADRATFEFLDVNGVHIYNNGLIDDVNSLNNCTFQNGETGGTLLRINTNQVINIENAHFPENTWGSNNNVTKTTTIGDITMTNATGDFSGEGFENDPNNLITWELPEFDLELKLFLEGPMNSTLMNFDLMDEIPMSQPYSGHPWYYSGTESVAELPGKTVDWILVELRDATHATVATEGTVIARQAAFLKNNGIVLDLDGTEFLQFNQNVTNNLYVVIWQRNHLGIMSAYPLIKTGNTYVYDFSTASSQTHGGITGTKQISPGIWGMIGGDANLNGAVNSFDKGYWNVYVGRKGYLNYDFNLDGQVDNQDKNEVLINNYGSQKQVPN